MEIPSAVPGKKERKCRKSHCILSIGNKSEEKQTGERTTNIFRVFESEKAAIFSGMSNS